MTKEAANHYLHWINKIESASCEVDDLPDDLWQNICFTADVLSIHSISHSVRRKLVHRSLDLADNWDKAVPDDLWADKQFVEIVLEKDSRHYHKMFETLKTDFPFVRSLVRANPDCLRDSHWIVRNDKEFVLSILQKCGEVEWLFFDNDALGENLWNDRDIISLIQNLNWSRLTGYENSLIGFLFGFSQLPLKVLESDGINGDIELMKLIAAKELAHHSSLKSLRYLSHNIEHFEFLKAIPGLAYGYAYKDDETHLTEEGMYTKYSLNGQNIIYEYYETLLTSISTDWLDNTDFLLRFRGDYPILRFASNRLKNDVSFLEAYAGEEILLVSDSEYWTTEAQWHFRTDGLEYSTAVVLNDIILRGTQKFFNNEHRAFYFATHCISSYPNYQEDVRIQRMKEIFEKVLNGSSESLIHHLVSSDFKNVSFDFHPILNLPIRFRQDQAFIKKVIEWSDADVANILFSVYGDLEIDEDLATEALDTSDLSVLLLGEHLMFEDEFIRRLYGKSFGSRPF